MSCLLSARLRPHPPAPAQPAPPSTPQQEGYVDAHGVLIYYVAFGKGYPLVVLHGGPGAGHDLFSALPAAAGAHPSAHLYRRARLGPFPALQDASRYTVEAMVEDIEDVRVALHLGKISLLGHSCGGVLAQAYALKYQQNLSHLILNSHFPLHKGDERGAGPGKGADAAREAEAAERIGTGGPVWQGRGLGARPLPGRVRQRWPGARAIFPFSTARGPTPTTTRPPAMRPPTGSSTARCGARTASSSSTAT